MRGVDDTGADLVISRDYISHGLRSRAEDLVSIELGPRPEHVLRHARPGEWGVALEAERHLRDLGLRGDIIKTTLRRRELDAVGTELAGKTGLAYQTAEAGDDGGGIEWSLGRKRDLGI